MKNHILMLAAATAFCAEQANAQTASSTTETATAAAPSASISTPQGIGDIVVTAQKRSERLQDVPISIVAVTGASLARSGINNVDGLQRLAPGLSISNVGSGFVSYTYLRGAGTNTIDAGADPSIAYYLDEVYLGAKAGLQFDLLDVDRVEVLKGPQGTLFGRNAAAGAISVTSRRPSSSFGADFSGELGDYAERLFRGTVSGPIAGDSVRYRLSLGSRHQDGFTENLAGGSDPGRINSLAGRGQLEFVGKDATFLLTGEALRTRNGMTNQFIDALPGATLSAAAVATLPPGESFYKHYYNYDGFEHQNSYAVTGRLEWSTPIGALTSISAYRDDHFIRDQDQDGTIKDAFVLNTNERTRTFSQEVRLASSNNGSRLKWLLGLYYYHANVNTRFDVITGRDFAVPALQGVTRSDIGLIKTDSFAAFAQASYDFTDKLSLTAGGRYTKDRKNDARTVIAPSPFAAYSVHPYGSWDSFDPAVTINYKPIRDVLIYASYKQGFKSGGFQSLLPPTAAIANITYAPERVKSYEAGFKSSFLNRRFIVNVSAFQADITNQQIGRSVTTTQIFIDNAGATRARGVDVELIARPASALQLSATFTYQHARFRKYESAGVSYAGFAQLRSPDFTGIFAADYDLNVGAGAKVALHGEYSYRTVTYFDNANGTINGVRIPGLYQPGYGLVNANIVFHPESDRWSVGIFGRNLGGAKYFRNIATAQGLVVPGDPLTFGASFAYHFR